jgi:hypothetical protein
MTIPTYVDGQVREDCRILLAFIGLRSLRAPVRSTYVVLPRIGQHAQGVFDVNEGGAGVYYTRRPSALRHIGGGGSPLRH